MKKKILALTSAVALTVMSSMTVFAAGSPSVGTVVPNPAQPTTTALADLSDASVTTASAGYTVSEPSAQTKQAADVAVQNLILNNLAAVGAATGNVAIVSASADANGVVTAAVLDTVDVKPDSATKDANGNYVVGLANNLVAAGDTIIVLHYNGTSWEVIYPSQVSDGLVVFATSSLSPISIVKLNINSVAQAPKTGSTLPLVSLLFVVFAAGAVLCGKKYFA